MKTNQRYIYRQLREVRLIGFSLLREFNLFLRRTHIRCWLAEEFLSNFEGYLAVFTLSVVLSYRPYILIKVIVPVVFTKSRNISQDIDEYICITVKRGSVGRIRFYDERSDRSEKADCSEKFDA